jgi:hypothetical protein
VNKLRGQVREGDPLLLDADQALAFVRPTRDMAIAFDERFAKTACARPNMPRCAMWCRSPPMARASP